jgi:hypothetical protein
VNFPVSCVHLPLVQNQIWPFLVPVNSFSHLSRGILDSYLAISLSYRFPNNNHLFFPSSRLIPSSGVMNSEAGPSSSVHRPDDKGKRKRLQSPSQDLMSKKVYFSKCMGFPCHM